MVNINNEINKKYKQIKLEDINKASHYLELVIFINVYY